VTKVDRVGPMVKGKTPQAPQDKQKFQKSAKGTFGCFLAFPNQAILS